MNIPEARATYEWSAWGEAQKIRQGGGRASTEGAPIGILPEA